MINSSVYGSSIYQSNSVIGGLQKSILKKRGQEVESSLQLKEESFESAGDIYGDEEEENDKQNKGKSPQPRFGSPKNFKVQYD